MKLPQAARAVIESRKIRGYLLSPEHPVGRFKALFFEQLGFSTKNWQELRSELRRIALQGEARATETTGYGKKYVVRGTIVSPTGRTAEVLTVWIVLVGETAPRFVTAYPEH